MIISHWLATLAWHFAFRSPAGARSGNSSRRRQASLSSGFVRIERCEPRQLLTAPSPAEVLVVSLAAAANTLQTEMQQADDADADTETKAVLAKYAGVFLAGLADFDAQDTAYTQYDTDMAAVPAAPVAITNTDFTTRYSDANNALQLALTNAYTAYSSPADTLETTYVTLVNTSNATYRTAVGNALSTWTSKIQSAANTYNSTVDTKFADYQIAISDARDALITAQSDADADIVQAEQDYDNGAQNAPAGLSMDEYANYYAGLNNTVQAARHTYYVSQADATKDATTARENGLATFIVAEQGAFLAYSLDAFGAYAAYVSSEATAWSALNKSVNSGWATFQSSLGSLNAGYGNSVRQASAANDAAISGIVRDWTITETIAANAAGSLTADDVAAIAQNSTASTTWFIAMVNSSTAYSAATSGVDAAFDGKIAQAGATYANAAVTAQVKHEIAVAQAYAVYESAVATEVVDSLIADANATRDSRIDAAAAGANSVRGSADSSYTWKVTPDSPGYWATMMFGIDAPPPDSKPKVANSVDAANRAAQAVADDLNANSPPVLFEAEPPPQFPGFKGDRYQEHDERIVNLVDEFNANKAAFVGCTPAQAAKIPDLTTALVKSWLIQETGGNGQTSIAAWKVDPAQVNVPGKDWDEMKTTLGLQRPTQRNEGDIDTNLKAAIIGLARKGFWPSFKAPQESTARFFDGWQTALDRYGPPNRKPFYGSQIVKRATDLSKEYKIELPK